GRNLGAEERLVGVDVADASQDLLAEQRGFDGSAPRRERSMKDGWRDGQCIGTELLQAGTRSAVGDPLDFAELAYVAEGHAPTPVLEHQVHLRVPRNGFGRDATRHAQVTQEARAVVELG